MLLYTMEQWDKMDMGGWGSPNHPRIGVDSKLSKMDWESPNHPRKELPPTRQRVRSLRSTADELIDLWKKEKKNMPIQMSHRRTGFDRWKQTGAVLPQVRIYGY